MRLRIYESVYWKQHCFGLTSAALVEKAAALDYYGGVKSYTNSPTPFLCLLLKLLQLLPELGIVKLLISNQEFKYMRLLGAYYLRLTGTPVQIYSILEPLYSDYRKVRKLTVSGWELFHVDEVIHELLTGEISLNMALPKLADRDTLVEVGMLLPYKSLLDGEMDAASSESETSSSEDQ